MLRSWYDTIVPRIVAARNTTLAHSLVRLNGLPGKDATVLFRMPLWIRPRPRCTRILLAAAFPAGSLEQERGGDSQKKLEP